MFLRAAAAITPSGPPPVPINISTPNFLSETNKAPDTSPSEIYFIFTFNLFNSFIIFLCLGLSKYTYSYFIWFFYLLLSE